MQGGGKNVIEAKEEMSALQRKLKLWWHRLENNNFADFSLMLKVIISFDIAMNDDVSDNELQMLKSVFTDHLQK